MSGVKIMRALMLANAPLTAAVGTAVHSGTIDIAVPLPAVALREISRSGRLTVGMSESHRQVTSRVQLTVYAKTYPAMKTILDAARLGPGAQTGMVAGLYVLSVLPVEVGPELENTDAAIHMQSRDFLVSYREPV